jgi:protein SCO1
MNLNLLETFFAPLHHGLEISNAMTQRRKVIVMLFCVLLTACQSKPQPQGKRYELKGTIVSVDKAHSSALISHEEIKDYMEAMTMSYTLKDAWPLDVMKPGDEIQATLVVTDSSSWLEDVVVTEKSAAQTATTPESSAQPRPGDAVPDFHLINQDGKAVHLAQYKGKALLLTFIYTRCPVPEYCTLMSNNFAEINQELQKDSKLYDKTHLLSISFDPEYDSPQVLRSYGAAHTGNYNKETFSHWEFVTGDAAEVKKMAEFFGFTYIPEKDQIVHTLQTVLIGPDGKVVKLYPGNEWKPSEVLREIQSLFGKS